MKCPVKLIVSRRRGGGKVRIPRSLRDLQVERKSLFLVFSFQRLFHRLELLFRQRHQELSLRAVLSDTVSCDGEGQCLIQVLVDDDLASGQGGAPLGKLDLHDKVVKAYSVVSVNRALESLREDHFQVPVPAGDKRRTPLRCRNCKSAVELSNVVIVEKLVGRLQCSDPAQSQLLGKSSLPGGEVALRPIPPAASTAPPHPRP